MKNKTPQELGKELVESSAAAVAMKRESQSSLAVGYFTTIPVKIQFVSNEAKELYNGKLKYATEGSSGFDLRVCGVDASFDQTRGFEGMVLPGGRILVKTGIKVNLQNNNYEIQIRSRSGLALKNGAFVLNSPGTIDADYQQEICVIIQNNGILPFVIEKGDRICQAVICPITKANFEYVENIEDGERGGFGSTGVK